MTDADSSYPNGDIPRLLEHIDSYDMVIGARKTEKGTFKFLRKPTKTIIVWLASYIAGRRISDLNSGFRAFSKELALKYLSMLPEGHSWVSTITLAFMSHGHSVKYIPIDYYPRKGKSSFHPVRDTTTTILLVFRTIMYFRPLRIFLPPGLLLLFAAFAGSVYNAKSVHRIKESDTIAFMTALIVLSIGLIADLIVKMRREG